MMRTITAVAVWLIATSSVPSILSAKTADACYQATLKVDVPAIIAICDAAFKAGGLSAKTKAQVLSNRGLGYLRKGDYDRAIIDFDAAISADPKLAYAYDNRGEARREKGQYDQAITDFNAAIRVDGTFIAAYLNRALTFEKLNNTASAVADLKFVLESKGDREIDKWARNEAKIHLTRIEGAKR